MTYSIADVCYCNTTDVSAGGGALCADTTNCTTRWGAIKAAMKTTLSTSRYVNWGLKFFSSPNSPECGVAKDPEVQVGSDTAQTIQTQIETSTLSQSTPTTAAINTATAYLKTLSDQNKKFILLATDGEPNCAGNPAISTKGDVPGATVAVSAAKAAGFPVYVIGIGPSVTTLSQLAQAGGTSDFYPANSPAQLAEALSSISKIVGSCSFKATDVPPDADNVAVYFNKQQVAKDMDDGWRYGATPQDIELTGQYCEQITAGVETTVQILFGCPGAPPLPAFIP